MGVRRRAGAALAILCLLAAAVAIGWSAHTVFTPPAPLATAAYTTATVAEATVSDSLDLSAVAKWRENTVGSNAAAGTVTSVDIGPGDRATAGSTLYTVNLRPVVVAAGSIPMFRAITAGTRGDDVRQLQTMLGSTGHYTGTIDGHAEALTSKAIVDWQRSLGVEADGVVQAADVIFVPRLPARLTLDPATIATGLTVVGGERAVALLDDAPAIDLTATPQEAESVPEGAPVEVTTPDGAIWEALTAGRSSDDENGVVRIALEAPDGAPCGDACGSLSIGAETVLSASVVLEPETSGPAVPTAALQTTGAGDVFVVDQRGIEHTVTVIATSDGLSVLDGVEVGMVVRLTTTATGRGDG